MYKKVHCLFEQSGTFKNETKFIRKSKYRFNRF